jgi:aminomethyltransferase
MEQFRTHAPHVELEDLRPSTVAIAVQGPDAPAILEQVLGFAPKRFRTAAGSFAGQPVWAAGTGYTGEGGGEVVLPLESAEEFVEAIGAAGSTACGLGARDTLRLEAGLPLWGQEMDDEIDPLSAGLGFAVKWDHEFTGRAALEEIRESGHAVPVAFRTPDRRIPRPGMRLRSDGIEGVVSSGSFSPMLECGIGLGRLDGELGADLTVEIRGSWVEVEPVRPPFHR